ncbi:MAG: KpsF/GutQ family sugar-phosphate isomerase, partial [Armatimonadota bacterium]|nr:KpsF/GutQ family sugar-phosphate isomerase [Armatimonadota bacterium]
MHNRLADAIRIGQEAIRAEAAAVEALVSRLDDRFTEAVRLILDTPGRAILTGMGKSGAIAQKLAATFCSTGTPAFYLHPAEGVHGDLGAVTPSDIVIGLSYSGETEEISAIIPSLKRLPVHIIALVSAPGSTLGRAADVVLDVTVEREACPLNLAPTASTTAMLAMGDALAMAAMHARAFTREQFALYHPAGSLGRQLLIIDDVMRRDNENVMI